MVRLFITLELLFAASTAIDSLWLSKWFSANVSAMNCNIFRVRSDSKIFVQTNRKSNIVGAKELLMDRCTTFDGNGIHKQRRKAMFRTETVKRWFQQASTITLEVKFIAQNALQV